MNDTVFITRGRKYHTDEKCPLMVGGEMLWDDAGEDWIHIAGSLRRTVTATTAALRGRLPCLHCVPADQRKFPPVYVDFGHTPVDEYEGTAEGARGATHLVCARCRTWTHWNDVGVWVGVNVPWPCTSAVVLGLAPRGSVACTYCTDGSDPEDQGDWVSEVGTYNPYTSAPCPYCHGTRAALSPCATGECEELHL